MKGGILPEVLLILIILVCTTLAYNTRAEEVGPRIGSTVTHNKSNIVLTLEDGREIVYQVKRESDYGKCAPHPIHNNHWEGEKCKKGK